MFSSHQSVNSPQYPEPPQSKAISKLRLLNLSKSSRSVLSTTPSTHDSSHNHSAFPRQSSTQASLELCRAKPYESPYGGYPVDLGMEREIVLTGSPQVSHKSPFMNLRYFKSRNPSDSNLDQDRLNRLDFSKPYDPSNQSRASSETLNSHFSKSSAFSRRCHEPTVGAGFTKFESVQPAKPPASTSLGSSLGLACEGTAQQPPIGRDDRGAQNASENAGVSRTGFEAVARTRSSPPLGSQLSQTEPQAPTNHPHHPVTRHRRFATCEVLETKPHEQSNSGGQFAVTTDSTNSPFHSSSARSHLPESVQPDRSSDAEQTHHFAGDQDHLDSKLVDRENASSKATISASDHKSTVARVSSDLPIRLESKDNLVDMLEILVGGDLIRSVVNVAQLKKSCNTSAMFSIPGANFTVPIVLKTADSKPCEKPLYTLDPTTLIQPKSAPANQSFLTRLGWRSKATNVKPRRIEPNVARVEEPLVDARVASRGRQTFELPSVDTRGSCRVSFGGQKHYLPIIAVRTVEEIGKRGMKTPGLLQREGDLHRVQQLSRIYGTSTTYGYDYDLAQEDIHTICSVLIRFVKALPQPLLSHELSELLWVLCVRVASGPRTSDRSHPTSEGVLIAQCILRLMPPRQFSLLICLFSFMAKTLRFPDNGLTLLAIAGVFGPALFCPRKPSGELDLGTSKVSRPLGPTKAVDVLVWMLANWKAISTGLLVELFELKELSTSMISTPTEGSVDVNHVHVKRGKVNVNHLGVKQEVRSGLEPFPTNLPNNFPVQARNAFRRRRSTFDSSQFEPWAASQSHKRPLASILKHIRTKSLAPSSISPVREALPPLPSSLSSDVIKDAIHSPLPNRDSTVAPVAQMIMPLSVHQDTPVQSNASCPQPSSLTEGRRLNRSRSSRVLSTQMVHPMRHLRSTSVEESQLYLPQIAKPTLKTMREILAEKSEAMPSQADQFQDFNTDLASPTSDAPSFQSKPGHDDLSHDSLRASAAFVYATWLSVEVNQGNVEQRAQIRLASGDVILEEDMKDGEGADVVSL